MSRTNSQAQIISEEQLVPCANRLVIKKNSQRVALDSHIIDTMLRFVVEILRHQKLYNPVSLTTTLPPPDPNNTYIQHPSEIQILEFIKILGYDKDLETKLITVSKMVATRLHQPWRAILSVLNRCLTGKDSSWDTVRLPILQILWGIVHSANLDFASLIWDEFEWQTVERSSRPSKMSKLLYTRFTKLIIDYLLLLNKSIPRRSDSKLHSSQDDHPITKLLNTTNSDYKFGMEVPDAMISDAIKKKARYKYYMAKKVESEKAKIVDKPEEQHVSPIKSGRGKGELAKSISIQEPRSQRRRRSQLTIDSQTNEAVADMYNEWGQKLKGPAVEDPTVQLDLRKGSKDSRLESLRQKKQPVAGEGSSDEESENETDDVDESDMDLSHDNSHGDDDDARYGVFMHNKSTATPISTYFSPTVTSSSLDFIQTLLDETPANELTDFMSHPLYIDAHTTSVVNNLEGNPKLTSYISGASEVPLVTHVDVLATKTLMQEMFPNKNAHHIPSPSAKKIPYHTTTPQPSSLQAKAKKLMQKAKKNMRKFNFKKAVA
ncbi:hypothetical protein Tco_1525693 [Tanacetum coccineum]